MAIVDDVAPFFTDFGVAATVGGVALTGIFDNAFADPFGIVASTSPVLLIPTAAAPAVAVGSAVVVPAGTYTVADIQPDGTGITRLGLKG